jgi:hypothetical protein
MVTYKGGLVIGRRRGAERKMIKNKHLIVWSERAGSNGNACDSRLALAGLNLSQIALAVRTQVFGGFARSHEVNAEIKSSSNFIPLTGRGGLEDCEMSRIPHF